VAQGEVFHLADRKKKEGFKKLSAKNIAVQGLKVMFSLTLLWIS